jgi:hypothetical protein
MNWKVTVNARCAWVEFDAEGIISTRPFLGEISWVEIV